jgi:hypothetical protein
MSKLKYLSAAVACTAITLAAAAPASADITWQGQSLVVDAKSPRLDKKKPGGLNSLFVDVITNYQNAGGVPDRWAVNTKLYFPTDFVFKTAGLPRCEPTPAFTNGTRANAIALCGPSRVSIQGAATLSSGLGDFPAVVTAFNGTPDPATGAPRILLHSETSLANRTLIGTLVNSNQPGFGRMLDVPVDLGPFQGTAVITDFQVTIGKVRLPVSKKTKKSLAKQQRKCKKVKNKAKRNRCLKNVKRKRNAAKNNFFAMSSCRNRTWNFQARTTYNVGSPSVANATDTCLQTKKKKKK